MIRHAIGAGIDDIESSLLYCFDLIGLTFG